MLRCPSIPVLPFFPSYEPLYIWFDDFQGLRSELHQVGCWGRSVHHEIGELCHGNSTYQTEANWALKWLFIYGLPSDKLAVCYWKCPFSSVISPWKWWFFIANSELTVLADPLPSEELLGDRDPSAFGLSRVETQFGGFHSHGGTPKLMVDFMDNPI